MLSYTQGDPFIETEEPSSPRHSQHPSGTPPAGHSGTDSKNASLTASATRDSLPATAPHHRGSPFSGLTSSSLSSLATSVASVLSAAAAPIFASGSPTAQQNSSKKRKSIPPLMRPLDPASGATSATSEFHSNSSPSLPTLPSPYPQSHQLLAATTSGALSSQDRGMLGTSTATNYSTKEYQPPKRALSLCMHCFDTLHSDFNIAPLSHRKVQNQEHEDAYYKGYLWAHVRCLFDSATQPLIPTLADEEEIAKADASRHHHHNHHHNQHSHRSGTGSHPGSGAALTNSSEGFFPRHIGSDQSIHSSSSGAESGTSSFPVSESSGASRADAQTFVMNTVKISDLTNSTSSDSALLDEWVLMEALPSTKLDMEYMSDEERSEHAFSRSSRDRDSAYTSDPEDFDTRSHHSDTSESSGDDEVEETLFDAGKRQALNFLVQDDIMRPAELSDAIQPFIQSFEPSQHNSKKKIGSGAASLSTPASGNRPVFLPPEPVFELTLDLQHELSAHKARSVFEYGLNRDWNPAPQRAKTPGGLPPLSALSSLDIVVDPVVPTSNSSSYSAGYGVPNNGILPSAASGYGAPSNGYGAPSNMKDSFSPTVVVPSGYTNGAEGYLASHDTTSGYGAPSPMWNGGASINPYGEPVPQSKPALRPIASPSAITPSSITPYTISDDPVDTGFDTAPLQAQPYSDVPFSAVGTLAPLSNGNAYSDTPMKPSAGSAYSDAPMRPEAGRDEPNNPYFTESSGFVPASAQDLNEPDPTHRDWNSEWQAHVQELCEHRDETLHTLVTEPRSLEQIWERERSMTSLLHESGVLDIQSIDKFYAPDPKNPSSDSSLGGDSFSSTPDEDILQLAKDVISDVMDPKVRLERLSERLGEMTHLKADKSRYPQLMLCLIRIKTFLAEFMDTASRIAKKIVTEMTLPVDAKTVKPRNMGGIAGGEKYLEEGIFFKFAIDAYDVYGGDKFAMKAAAHELQGIKAFAETDIHGLFVPLSLLIDYCGYRLVASVRLPISQQTLIYGSSDGGTTIHQKDPIFNRMMEEAASHLNIKQHEVAPGVSLYSAVDMEGHKGTDGRYYVLDTARVFPPEPPLRTFIAVHIPHDTTSSHKWASSAPIAEIELIANRTRWQEQVRQHLLTGHRSMRTDDVTLLEGQVFFLEDNHRTLPLNSRASALAGCIIRGPAIYVVEPGQGSTQLFNLLRAPYVARQPHALSSDAFTSFGRIDQDIHNTEVEDAFYRLLGIDIPNFVKYITSPENNNTLTHDLLISTIKSFGINLRLLGFLRSHIPFNSANRAIRSMLLVEMVTRVAKNDLRASLRSARSIRRKEMCFTPHMCERQAHEIVLSTFNLLLGNSTTSTFLWNTFMKTHIIVKYGQYGQALTEAELDPTYDLRNEVNKLQLFQTLTLQAGIKFKDEVNIRFQQHPDYFEVSAPFGPDDIEDMLPKRKSHLEVKVQQIFYAASRGLPTITMRLEAMRGFSGPEGRELGFTALCLAHVLNRFEATIHLVPAAVNFALSVFAAKSSSTPAEVTAKAFYLLSTTSLSKADYDLAEAQLKASYNSYRRALTNHISSRPLEVGARFLLLILDRLVWLMDHQGRRFEAFYYAQKFTRIWQSIPYPGDIKDLEVLLGRPGPLAFALLWERDYFMSAGHRTFLNQSTGQITDNVGNVYTNTDDFILSSHTGHVFPKTNLIDENMQELPELTPEVRWNLEHDMFKNTAIADEDLAYLWRSVFKTIDDSTLSGFHMSFEVWEDYIKSGAWKKDRFFDSRIIRRAIWTPTVSTLYNNAVLKPNQIAAAPHDLEADEVGAPQAAHSPSTPHHPDGSKPVGLTTSKPSQLTHMTSNTSINSSAASHYSGSAATLMTGSTALSQSHSMSSNMTNSVNSMNSAHSGQQHNPAASTASITSSTTNDAMFALYGAGAAAARDASAGSATAPPSSSPCLPASTTSPTASPMAGTIKSPHILKSGKQPKFTFNWHLGREWNREVTGTEYFVLVRYEPNVWVLPAFFNSRTVNVTREGRRILTGPEIGQFIEGQHVVIASMPARLMRTFGTESWEGLDLEYGFYQVHLVTATGQLWGKTTSIPCFILTNSTHVLSRTAKHHVLRWNEQTNWMSSVLQAQGISFTHFTYVPLGAGFGTAYWTDSSNQLWYGFSEPHAQIPSYVRQAMPAEEVLRLQLNPLIMPMPSDFAQTFQEVAKILGTDISVFASEAQAPQNSKDKRRSTATLQNSTANGGANATPGSKSGTLNRTLSPPNLNGALSSSSSVSSSHSSSTLHTAATSTTGTGGSSFANAAAAAGAAALAPHELERAQSASSFSTAHSSSSIKSRPSSASNDPKRKVLSEDFWKDQKKCDADCALETSVLHFDSTGQRVPPGSSVINSVIVLKSVESQLSPGMMWSKMRKVPSLATEKVTKVVASNSHVMALLANGDVYTWGNNLYGELGHGDLVRLEEPRVVKRLRGKQVRDIAAGLGRSIALLSGNRTVYQWGMDFSLFPEPHPFWKTLPDEEVVKVVFQTQNGLGTPQTFDPDIAGNIPNVPKDVPSYRIFEHQHNITANPLWHSNLMLYLTDTGRAYAFGHDPFELFFKQHKPMLLEVAEDQPVLDAAIGSNFIVFLGEEGTVWSTGYNELGQRGSGIVGDPGLDNEPKHALLRKSSSTVSPAYAAFTRDSRHLEDMSHAMERHTHTRRPTTTEKEGVASGKSAAHNYGAWIRSTAASGGPRHSVVSSSGSKLNDSTGRRGNAARSGGLSGGLYGGPSIADTQTLAWEQERAEHPMNHAVLPAPACKVAFSEQTKIVQFAVRSKKVMALSDTGVVWHWGSGVYVPAKLTSMAFDVADIAIHPSGVLLHTGPQMHPVQTLSERGRTRRKALGLEKPSMCDIQAKQMLWTPSGLKPWVEGSTVPSKCRVVVVIDWRRPPPSIDDNAEEIRFVTPGSDKVEGAPRSVSEISVKLPAMPQRRGQYVVDFLNPRVTKWSIDQGIANGNLDRFLEPLLTWAPLTEEAREVLGRRRDRRAASVRQMLMERQNKIIADARALAEQRFNEMRTQGPISLSASSSFSNLPPLAYGTASMPVVPSAPTPTPIAVVSASVISPSPASLNAPSPLHRRTSRASLLRGGSTSTLPVVDLAQSSPALPSGATASIQAPTPVVASATPAAVQAVASQRPQPGSAASSTVGRSASAHWDGSAAFLDVDSASSGIPELTESALMEFNPDQEEYAPMIPPGEYEVVMVATKPTLQILARSKPVRFTYEGIKASVEVENTTMIGEKHVVAHWKCEMKLPGLKVIAREVESNKVIHSEPLLQRTQGTVRWRLRVGSSYRIFIERTDEAERTHAICESPTIEVLQAPSGFGSTSMMSALNAMPLEVEICTEWSTFFRQQCGLPAEVVAKYSSLATAAQIQTTFAISLDSGFLDKLGITDIKHQVMILNAVHRHREAHVRAILAQELQKMMDSCSASQFDPSSSSLHHT